MAKIWAKPIVAAAFALDPKFAARVGG